MARLGIGLDNIDVACCTLRKIVVTNVPDYCLIEVAEHALALLLALARKVGFYHWQTKSGTYDLAAGPTLSRIEGQTLGIVGLGNIGRVLAGKAAGLGAEGRGYQPFRARRSGGRKAGRLERLADHERLCLAPSARRPRNTAAHRRAGAGPHEAELPI